MRALLLLLLAASATLASCRDVGEPFRPTDGEGAAGPEVRRVTFSPSDDRAPAWSADGDTIYYTTSSWEENPLAPGTIVAIPADGSGPGRALLPRVQVGNQARAWLTAIATGPGDQVAFVRVLPLLPEQPCGTERCSLDTVRPMVRLTAAELHVRNRAAIGDLAEDTILPLVLSGYSVVEDESQPGDVLTVSNYHPFQLQFEAEGRSFFRPAWSPNGTRLAVSDGLRVHTWDMGADAPRPLPFSQDGFMPAWSPDGEWIAFAQYPRVASEVIDCIYIFNMRHACSERRIIHHHADPEIVLVRADGSERIALGIPGTDPAWSPDGQYVYVSSTLRGYPIIARIDVETAEVDPIEGSEGGIEPAISPDGAHIAFARRSDAAHDIWAMELP